MVYRYSVVIPHYNSAEMLKRMLKSIPEREDLQVIVADDCSKPEEQEKLRQLKHKNLTLLFQKENKGAGAARNLGLSHVEGKWVTFADADDMYAEGAFDILDQNIDDSLDYLCFYSKNVMDDTDEEVKNLMYYEKIVRSFYSRPTEAEKRKFLYRNNVCWNKLVRMDFIRNNKVCFEASPVNNDVLYTLYVGIYGKSYKIVPHELYIWRINRKSMTQSTRTIEKEFLFYIQAQKRNGLFKKMGLHYYPFYRNDGLYVLHFLKKRGIKDTIAFFKYRKENIEKVEKAKVAYLDIFDLKQ